MTIDFLPTFTVLLLAHALGDFTFQSKDMAERKAHWGVLLFHGLIHLWLMVLLLGTLDAPVIYVVAVVHMIVDAIKARVPDGLRPFMLDQTAHIMTLVAAASYAPNLWADSPWAAHAPDGTLKAMLLVAGLILTVWGGGHAVSKLLMPHASHWNRAQIMSGGLSEAGRVIGQLERALAFGLVLINLPGSVAILIAAKSVLRFSDSQSSRRLAEYVIIGTLASVGWAFAMAYGISKLLPLLP